MGKIKVKNVRKQAEFHLPPRGSLEPAGLLDPLPLYYHPIFGFLYRARIKQALSLLTSPHESILELGYGSGILLPSLSRIGKRICGIDIESDPQRAQLCLKKMGVDVSLTRGDMHDTGYPDESFDLIVAISVFEHIAEPKPAIEEVCRLLRPGGEFLVGIPRVDSLMEKLFPFTGDSNIRSRHVTDYRRILEAGGNCLELVKFSKLPSLFPLYFNILFRKLP